MSESKAFEDGLKDGEVWDLDGYASVAEALADNPSGWSEATLNALGTRACAEMWGVAVAEEPAWELAQDDYDRGIRVALQGRVSQFAYRIERQDGTTDGLGDEVLFASEAEAWTAAETAFGSDPASDVGGVRAWLRVVAVDQ
jgi:hypothetical protein